MQREAGVEEGKVAMTNDVAEQRTPKSVSESICFGHIGQSKDVDRPSLLDGNSGSEGGLPLSPSRK